MQLAHGSSSHVTDAMLAVMEESLHSEGMASNTRDATLLSSLLLLAKRKRGDELPPRTENAVTDVLASYLRGDRVTEYPGPAALLSLLTTVVPSDSLAAASQRLLRNALSIHMEKQDVNRAALAILGASSFLRTRDLDSALDLIGTSVQTSSEGSLESMSYRLLAACFAKHGSPLKALAISERITASLVPALLRVSRPFTTGSTDPDSWVERALLAPPPVILRQCALALCALHQVGAVDLITCATEPLREVTDRGS